MTREEIVRGLNAVNKECGEHLGESFAWMAEIFQATIGELEQEPCEDAVSRQAVLDNAYAYGNGLEPEGYCVNIEDIQALPSVAPTPKWIPVSEKLPKAFRFVNCTCHSLIDDREDWVIETVYIPQPSNSPYSDWGNIPMLNLGKAEVIAWMYRNIPEPYRAGMEGEE